MWRPSPTVNTTGCYSLVDNFMITSTSIAIEPLSEHVVRVTPLFQDQLQFQPGDVLGFYVESHTDFLPEDNGVVLLNNASYTSEFVWYGRITVAPNSQRGSCPYPIGTSHGRVLHSSTHAAPVISISIMTTSCSLFTTASILSPRPTSTMAHTDVHVYSSFSVTEVTLPPDKTLNFVVGISTPVMCVIVILITVTVVIVIIVYRKIRKYHKMTVSSSESAN